MFAVLENDGNINIHIPHIREVQMKRHLDSKPHGVPYDPWDWYIYLHGWLTILVTWILSVLILIDGL